MATSTRRHHPVRTLSIFLLVTAALYALMGFSHTWKPRTGLDLAGGSTITLTAANTEGNGQVSSTSLEQARHIIQQRVDGLGVGESSVTTQGSNHIVVSVPNVSGDDLTRMVGKTAQLTFRNVYKLEQVAPPAPSASATPAASASASGKATPGAKASTAPSASATPSAPGLPTAAPSAPASATKSTGKLLSLDKAMAWQPSANDLAAYDKFSCTQSYPDAPDLAFIACDHTKTQKYLLGPVVIEGTHVDKASYGVVQNGVQVAVNLAFDGQGKKDFGTVTTALVKKTEPLNQNAIVLDNEVISAPRIQAAILDGNAQITGNFTQDSAAQLTNVLNYGALPLKFDVSEVQTVSPTLGGEQLRAGIIAGLIGLGLVVLYSFLYYRGLALIVVGSLVIASVITWAVMSLLGAAVGFALNLPGIAGAIMAIGVTADSFIIYFERIRDEIRDGRALRSAIETGWKKARGTIIIADAVSLLSALVLFILAVGAVKGFAFTLGLTTLIDLAIVFWFTKPLMSLLGRTKFFGEGHKLSGLEAEHMGVSRNSLLGIRTSTNSARAQRTTRTSRASRRATSNTQEK